MAKKKQTRPAKKNEEVKQDRYCGNCGWGEFSHEFRNLDIEGNPICVTCPFERWKKIRDEAGCDKWKPKS